MGREEEQQTSADVKATIARFWSERADTFDDSPQHVSQSQEETTAWMDILERLTSGQTGLSVLDAGTGTGFLALLLAEMGQKVTGVDVSAGMLEQAVNKANESGLEVKFKEADAEDTGFDDSSFDLIVSRHVLWNLPDPARALSEWKRVTKPGGTVAVIDGHWNSDRPRASFADRWGQEYKDVFENLPLYGGATAERVASLFSSHGLENVQVEPLDALIEIKRQSMPEDMKDSHSRDRYLVSGMKLASA